MTLSIHNRQLGYGVAAAAGLTAAAMGTGYLFTRRRHGEPVEDWTLLEGTTWQYSPEFGERGEHACAAIASRMAIALLKNQITPQNAPAVIDDAVRVGVSLREDISLDQRIPIGHDLDGDTVLEYAPELRNETPNGGNMVQLESSAERANYTALLSPLSLQGDETRRPVVALVTVRPYTTALKYDPDRSVRSWTYFDSHGRDHVAPNRATLRRFDLPELAEHLAAYHPHVDAPHPTGLRNYRSWHTVSLRDTAQKTSLYNYFFR
jgi:hypothetical protein